MSLLGCARLERNNYNFHIGIAHLVACIRRDTHTVRLRVWSVCDNKAACAALGVTGRTCHHCFARLARADYEADGPHERCSDDHYTNATTQFWESRSAFAKRTNLQCSLPAFQQLFSKSVEFIEWQAAFPRHSDHQLFVFLLAKSVNVCCISICQR